MPLSQSEFVAKVKRLAIRAMFSDDELMDRLVLKGGNLLDIVYNVSPRASVDVDFSVDGGLGDVGELQARIAHSLASTFAEIRYEVFDVTVAEVPPTVSPEIKDFWGGYQIAFKIIEREKYVQFSTDREQLRRNAASVGKRGSSKFEIDISKHEYCAAKVRLEFDGLTIFGYTPAMIVCEKLRAICQQMPEYVQRLRKHATARARDFVDIHTVSVGYCLDFDSRDLHDLLTNIFAAKQVPVALLGMITDFREFHRPDFEAVRATIKPAFNLREFDFYFDFVVDSVGLLEPLWNE